MNLMLTGLVLFVATALFSDAPADRLLESVLLDEGPAALAIAVRERGDPARGAIVFQQPALSCAKCHGVGDGQGDTLGPDLAALGKGTSDSDLIDSVLRPSKVIKRGFETVKIALTEGTTLTGLLAEETPDRVILRDQARDGKLITVLKRNIDERSNNSPSMMPEGLVNALASRQQFLDLIAYLRAVADGGRERAKALRPDPALIAGWKLPDYESKIDHAGMIAGLDRESLERGQAIYQRVCANCHGTKDKEGSLPTSMRFSTGRFKNGSDPYRIYQTLTHGFGQMAAQTWMVPAQKYDVIHYIREAFLKVDNPTQFVAADRTYLDRLPRGTTRGPAPSTIEPWSAMDYGPTLTATYEVGAGGKNFAYKGVAIRLDAGPGGISRGHTWAVFDHDTMRMAAAWTGEGFIDWNGINFNGQHEVHPKVVGSVEFANPIGPGWANPESGAFVDPRIKGRDGRPYGPLPRSWAHYRGQYRHGDQVIIAYTVGTTEVLEMPGAEPATSPAIITRTFQIGPRERDMELQVARGRTSSLHTLTFGPGDNAAIAILGATAEKSSQHTELGGILAVLSPSVVGVRWSSTADCDLRFKIPAGPTKLEFVLKVAHVSSGGDANAVARSIKSGSVIDLRALTAASPARWPQVLKTAIVPGRDDGAFAVDTLGLPDNNPWLCQMRLTGFDFLDGGGTAAVCTWDGDVWLVSGLDARAGELSWRRIGSGLFQPLGLKVRDGNIFVGCRDQIVILRDINGDGETDFYENFNNDHQVTEHFHEFAMGLQTDAYGNFYYAKAARHGKTALVPQHGTLLKVGSDGLRTDILATGFRAPNGVCVNDDGTFFLTDQEGFWTPKNRINHVKVGGFYGNMWAYNEVTDPSDTAMEPPICWITNAFDRSPAELLRVTSKSWGPLQGSLLNLSYGNGKVFVAPYETVEATMQGGMCALPIPSLPTGIMRGRFHPTNGQLYACGMFAWAGNQTAPGGFYRIRATGKPTNLPTALHATKKGLRITFTDSLDRTVACNPTNYSLKTWSLKRTANYGSDHYDEKSLRIGAASLGEDGRTVSLTVPEIQPSWGMEIGYSLKGVRSDPYQGTIHNTIHHLSN